MPPITTVTCKFSEFTLTFNVQCSLKNVKTNAYQALSVLVKNPDDWEITY